MYCLCKFLTDRTLKRHTSFSSKLFAPVCSFRNYPDNYAGNDKYRINTQFNSGPKNTANYHATLQRAC
jgi:hypothetical protein